jgi:hypothetical protein
VSQKFALVHDSFLKNMLISYHNCYVFQHLKQHFFSQILRISSQHIFMWNIRSLPYTNRFVMKNRFRTWTFNSHNTSPKIRYAHNPDLIFQKMHCHHQKDTYIKETWGPGVLYYVISDFLQNLADTDTHFMFWKCSSM